MKHQLTKHLRTKSRNFLQAYSKCLFHSSPHLQRPRGGKKSIEIDASKEELFPTRRGNVLYEQELALSDKIRSVRIAKKRKMHQITTQKHANLIFEILQEALNNGRLKKANVTWEYLEFAPKFIDDGDDGSSDNNELDNYVQIDLVDVGFEIIGVTMPNHRQYCVIWWKYNHLCKLNGGTKLIEKVLDLYKNTLRAIISRKMALKMTPRLIFRKADDKNNENSSYHKEKMDYLVENALIEEYQKHLGLEFEREDNEEDRKYKNEQFHDLLMNKIYGDWRYDKNGNLLKPFNMQSEKKKINDKWIETFLNKTNGNRPTKIERDIIKKRRKQKHAEKHREKANLLNRILNTDPDYVINNNYNYVKYDKKTNDILISSKQLQQETDVVIHRKPRIKEKTQCDSIQMVLDHQDLDLVGIVE